MTECPELGALETSPLTPELRDHVSTCNSCKLVVEVFDAAAGRLDVDDCMRFDALLAARADGTLGRAAKNLLERHLASCSTCREVAETLSPTQDADGDHATLPQVDPASYEVGLEVARGGMGRVLAARDLRIGRPIAIKELLGRSPQLAARFEREARVTARLQHPGIVPIYEIGKWPDGTPFYSMRMVDGAKLADKIESAKTLTARLSLLPAVIAATEAVAFAHGKRVIHRDLTPSNVLVGAYGETVVIDWGLAKDLADGSADADEPDDEPSPEGSNERLTGVGAVIGTATYMPPEQAHAIPVDERADVYALGAILYHVLAGVPPYRAKTARDLLRAVKTAAPPPIEQVAPGTPKDLVSIISKAMARDPDVRYPSARELAEELKRFQTGRLVEAHVYSRYELFKRFLARHRAVVTVSAFAIVLTAVFGTIAVRNILRSNRVARTTVRELLLERGRTELLAGNTHRALAYLNEAYQRGDKSPLSLLLLGNALSSLSSSRFTLDCGGTVHMVAFDRGGRYVAAGCHDIAKVWRLSDGKELVKLETSDPGYDSVRFSNDGRLLATWGLSGRARVWDAETGALQATLLHGDNIEINRLSFTPDNARVSTTGDDGIARVWDVARQTQYRAFVGSTKPGFKALYGWFSSDGKLLYAMTPDGTGMGWEVESGTPLGERQHGSNAIGADLAPDSKLAVSCGQNGQIRLWDLEARTQRLEIPAHKEPVWKCIFSPDGKLVLTGGHDGHANIYDVTAGRLLTTVDHGDAVINADFSPDARRFTTVGLGGRVRLWDTRTGALLATIDAVRGKDARFSPDNEHLVAARGDGRIQVWKFETPTELEIDAESAVIGWNGTHVISEDGSLGRKVRIHELASKQTNIAAHELSAPFATASGASIVAGMRDGRVRVVDYASKTTRDLTVDHAPVKLDVSADGTRVVVMFDHGDAEVWDVTTGAKLVAIGAPYGMLSEDGRLAVAWGPEHPPVVWNVDGKTAGKPLATKNVTAIGFALRGKRLALRENTDLEKPHEVTLWNTESGALIAKQIDSSTSPTLDPSGRWLTTIDAEHSVTVWSTDDGEHHSSFLADQLTQAQVNPDGTFVAAIAEYGTVALLLNATDGRVLARRPLRHLPPRISASGFEPPTNGAVAWTRDGTSVISRSLGVTVWHVENRYTARQIAEIVRRNVPWRVDENGQLAWIRNGKLHGVVTRDGKPQPDLAITVEIRTPPDIGAAPVNWESSKNQVSTRKITTNNRGEFSIENLPQGEYTLTVGGQKFLEYVSADDEPITLELP